ncbi:hypothetical protein [Nonomuraea sp. NPDC001699]
MINHMREAVMAPTDNGWHLEQSWPGLVADRDGVEYSSTELEKVANAFWEKLPEVYGSDPTGQRSPRNAGQGSSPDVAQLGQLLNTFTEPLERIQSWDGGRNFAATLKQSHQGLTQVYHEVNQKLALAFALIDAGAGNYKRADAAIAVSKDMGWQET